MRFRSTFSSVIFVLIVFAAIASVPVLAQGRATVFGTVTDRSGAVVPGAHIVLTNIGTQQTQTTVSSGEGSYVIPSVTPGNYNLKVTAAGFETSVTSGVLIQVDENRKISPQLVVGAVSSEIQVTESVAQVDTRTATLSQVVDSERVKDLPLNGRNPLDLQLLVPGAGGTTNLSGQQQNQLISFNGNHLFSCLAIQPDQSVLQYRDLHD